MKYKNINCAECGTKFMPKTKNAKYCSDACRKTVALRRSKTQYSNKKPASQLPQSPEIIPPTETTKPPTEITKPPETNETDEDQGEHDNSFRGFYY